MNDREFKLDGGVGVISLQEDDPVAGPLRELVAFFRLTAEEGSTLTPSQRGALTRIRDRYGFDLTHEAMLLILWARAAQDWSDREVEDH